MSRSVQQSGIRNIRHSNAGYGRGPLSGSLFSLFALELFLIGIVVWSFLVNRHSFPNSYPNSFDNATDAIWGLTSLAAAAWGTWYLILSRRAAKRWNASHSRNLLAITVGSGAFLLGMFLLNIANVFVGDAIYMDVRDQFHSTRGIVESKATAALTGIAENGKKWFGMSCVTCHGPTGDGVANAAPSLRASQFLKTSDATTIANLIRNGRAATDPANKTGKVMPAKGGNPFLDESKIADLVAFLQNLESQFGGSSASSSSSRDLTSLPTQVASEPATIVRKWKLNDFLDFEVKRNEETVTTGMHAFVKATCNKCHMAAVAGKELGPTLDQIVKKYPPEKLLQHMLEPSAEIDEKFPTYTFLLLDGRTVSGVIVSESDNEIELATDLLKPDKLTTILVEEIDDRVKSKVSAMPERLLDVLTREEIEGLVAYVSASGNQLAVSSAPQLGRWVVPAVDSKMLPSDWAATGSSSLHSFGDVTIANQAERYASRFSLLFVVATSVLTLHFLWVVGSGAAIVMHNELQLSLNAQMQLAKQTFLFWSIGVAWLVLWFLLFFIIR
jgi:putative heme-binding domain-containing protein